MSRRLLPYLEPHRGALLLYVGVALVVAALDLAAPWPLKVFVDSVVGSHPLPGPLGDLLSALEGRKVALLAAVALAGVTLKLATSSLKICTSQLSVKVRQTIVLDVKSDLFQRLQTQSFRYYDVRRVGDLIYRVNADVWGVDELIVTLMPLLVAATSLLGMLGVMASLDWQLALLALVILPFLYSSYSVYSRRFGSRVAEVQRLEGESMSIVQEVLSALRVVKAFGREDREHARFLEQGRATAEARIKLTTQQVAYSTAVGLITVAGSSLVLAVGGLKILAGSLTLGELLVVLAYLASVYGPLESIHTAVAYTHGYLAKIRRIFEVLDAEPEIRDLPGAKPLHGVTGRVTLEEVWFGYEERDVLRDVSLEVEPGEVLGIVGPTGAGKTTLVSLVPRFYDPDRGRVAIDGRDLRELRVGSFRSQIAIVMQEPILLLGTIRENICYGRLDARFDEVVEAAKLAHAHEFIESLPNGYDTHVGERGAKLSGGERQRISIARAFLKDAPILILDEPTSAVDYKTEAAILEALTRLMIGRTTFMIAHRLSTLARADRIVTLDRGRIVESGTHAELIAARGLYFQLYTQSGRPAAQAKLGAASLP